MRCFLIVFCLLFIVLHDTNADPLLKPWTQRNLEEYETGIIKFDTSDGECSAYIKSRDMPEIQKSGLLGQVILPIEEWLGKRIKMTAYVKSIGVVKSAGLIMAVYTADGYDTYDDMKDRPIKGDLPWKQYYIVLDIPYNTVRIDFGVKLFGKGEIRVDNFEFIEVDMTVPVTGKAKERGYGKLRNLDFEGTDTEQKNKQID